MKAASFWSGVGASILAGLLLWWLTSFFEKKPEIEWYEVGSFELPADVNIVDEEASLGFPEVLRAYIVSNSGSLPAKDVRIEYTGTSPLILIDGENGQQSTPFNSGQQHIVVPAIGPRDQVSVFILSTFSGDLRVVLDGVQADRNYGGYIVMMSENRWISTSDIWNTIPFLLIFMGMLAALFSLNGLFYPTGPNSVKAPKDVSEESSKK